MVYVPKTAIRNMGKRMKRGKNETERGKKNYKGVLVLLSKPWGFLHPFLETL